MKIHKLHRTDRYGNGRTFCGVYTERLVGERRHLPRKQLRRDGGILLCVTSESAIKPTCRVCLRVLTDAP